MGRWETFFIAPPPIAHTQLVRGVPVGIINSDAHYSESLETMPEEMDNKTNPMPDAGPAKGAWIKFVVVIIIIALWYGALRVLPLDTWLLGMLTWLQRLGILGAALFILLYIPSCVLMFPDVLPNAAAGAIWGIGTGTVIVLIGRVLGSAATFLLTRSLAGRWSERRAAADPRFAAVSNAVGREGFRIVVLLRLCPLFPVIMLNYTLGLTRVSLTAYAMGTLFGMIPRTIFIAYLGSGARSLSGLVRGEDIHVAAHPAVYWGGLVASFIIMIILAYKARQYISEATK